MIQLLIDISMIMTGTRFTGIPRVVMEISRQLSDKKDIELHFLEFQHFAIIFGFHEKVLCDVL